MFMGVSLVHILCCVTVSILKDDLCSLEAFLFGRVLLNCDMFCLVFFLFFEICFIRTSDVMWIWYKMKTSLVFIWWKHHYVHCFSYLYVLFCRTNTNHFLFPVKLWAASFATVRKYYLDAMWLMVDVWWDVFTYCSLYLRAIHDWYHVLCFGCLMVLGNFKSSHLVLFRCCMEVWIFFLIYANITDWIGTIAV